jgi:pimeloyl-ACP methyl ester carboxylesterase
MEKRVAGDRLGLWGTSFSGGHVLMVAAKRPEAVHAVVSQVPFVSGVASTLRYPPKFLLPGLRRAVADGLRALVGGSPVTIPVVANQSLALLAPPDCSAGYGALVPKDSSWPNQVPARILLTLPLYNPAASASKIKAPTLMIGARDDSLVPIKAVRKTAAKLRNGKFVELPIGHFSPYSGEWFDKVVRLECDFLCENLSNRNA